MGWIMRKPVVADEASGYAEFNPDYQLDQAHTVHLVTADPDGGTWALEVAAEDGVWRPYVVGGSAVTGQDATAYVVVDEGFWQQIRVAFTTPGADAFARLQSRVTGF